jgi:hypothetical protein
MIRSSADPISRLSVSPGLMPSPIANGFQNCAVNNAGCRAKRSGRRRAAAASRTPSTRGAMSRRTRSNTSAESGLVLASSHKTHRMDLASSIWAITSTNGARTGIRRNITQRRVNETPKVLKTERAKFHAADPGGTRSKPRVPRIAAVCRRITHTPIMAFE